MSDIVMGAPWEAQLPARWEKPNLPVVDLRGRLPWISQQSKVTPSYVHLEPPGDLQELERADIREILCEMLASSVWEGGDGNGREEGKSYGESHVCATRA
jgi:hypothetical protein